MAWRPADQPTRPSAQLRARARRDREAAQTTRGRHGPNRGGGGASRSAGDHPGYHRDLQTERLAGEMVERTAPRTAETVQDMEDVGVDESSLSVPTKRKSKDTKVDIDKAKKLSTTEYHTHSSPHTRIPQDTHSLDDTHSPEDTRTPQNAHRPQDTHNL
ncbi:hypothetical protein D4764_12G0010450 [Takifugu flavidus]|uniref:Uncharacterized protein n=1 Tax=Takifugu flavidus TaxID=433684 RepID=A0A5C6PE35_9TELE|nr:hypothetical protein D4764_12G0010450 [Takifugu flavidus]